MVWYSHLFKNFTHFFVIHTVKDFSIVNEIEVNVFLEFSCFSHDSADVGNLISSSSAFSKSNFYISKLSVHVLLNPAAAAAAKSCQLCPTLCDPIDSSPPGSSIPGIFQARTLEWVAIAFSNA